MRTRTKQLWRMALVSLTLSAAAIVAPREARAEADSFGTGNGHGGAYVAAALDEVLNAYAPLTADATAGGATLAIGTPIGAPAGFVAGDLVLVWRATGVPAADAPPATPGPFDLTKASFGGGLVGKMELARVQTAIAGSLTLTKPLVNAWAKDVTQVVKVPELTTVSIPAGTSVRALAWQSAGTGFAGGIVAFLANGLVTVDGALSADGRGFRGGVKDLNFDVLTACPNGDGTEATGYAAKGEGVVSAQFGGTTHGGRANYANGAGGGNCAENGGGGGGHAGVGGAGGTAVLQTNRGGLGGGEIDYPLISRLAMGGGGGSGEQKNSVGSGGGAGGGVVFARALAIAGTGTISARGEDAANAGLIGLPVALQSDGAGGGGAGGSIHLRAVTTVTCGSASTKGGKGGDTALATLGTYGAGGGGAGGRLVIQSKSSAACPVDVGAGAAGVAGVIGQAPAGVGGPGENQGPPSGPYCFSNSPADPQCENPTPICDVASGSCAGCTGPFGGGTPRACTVAVQPVCAPNGGCNPCDGDFGTFSAFGCQLTTSPYCFLTGPTTGSCGKCTTSADCAGAGHGGAACEPISGTCGAPCSDDSQCKSAEWCAAGVCVPKTPNGDHVPNQPPISGECTVEKGKRVCLSAVCEIDDDLCGLKNGSPCNGVNEECRSNICFAGDKLCGKPTGEPCGGNGECRSDMCTGGVCTGCIDDANCGTGKVCDKDRKECVVGCREVNGKSNCVAPAGCSKHDGTIGQCVGTGDGGTTTDDGGALGADDAGIIEGGGCACRVSVPIAGSPFALAGAAIAALLLARRRRDRSKTGHEDRS